MRYDLVIRNGAVVTSEGVEHLCIAVSDGVVAEVAPEIPGDAAEEIDASGLHVFPGVIDVHVHFNEPGRADWEGFATGSAAFAAGGGTCYFDMPLNSSPPTLDGPSFDLKRKAAEAQSVADFGLWGGLIPGDLDRLDELAERGVVGFKAFMCESGIPDFEKVDDRTLLDGMARAAELRLPVAVHAENDDLTRRSGSSIRDYLNSRPVVAELEAIRRAILFAEETRCSLHIVHVSCGRGVALVEEARLRGVDVTCETCPHYLVLTEEDMERIGPAAKCAPPLRSQADRTDLWNRLLRGEIDVVASDHSPSPPEMKRSDNFFDVWGGISGCQTMLAILLGQEKLAPSTLSDLLARVPAERFRLPDKGRIEAGWDADLALVDMNDSRLLGMEDLLYRHPISPFLPLRRYVRRTLVRGRTVCVDGKPTGMRAGRLVRPALDPAT